MQRLALTECFRFLPLNNTEAATQALLIRCAFMMPDHGTAHSLPTFEQRRSVEFKLCLKNRFRNLRKPDKCARNGMIDTNPQK